MRRRPTRLSRVALFLSLGIAAATAGAPAASAPPEPLLAGVPRSDFGLRRAATLAALPDGVLVLRGSVEEEFGEVGRFRQNNWFLYLTGVEIPGAYLVLDPGAAEPSRAVLYIPPRNPAHERWTGPKLGPGPDAARQFGFGEVRSTERLDDDLRAILAARPAAAPAKLYTVIPGGDDARFRRETALVERLTGLIPADKKGAWALADVSYALGELRRTKSPAELALLQRAIDITGEAQLEVARIAAPGRFEYEAEAGIMSAYLRNGALRAGFPSIVGSGIFSTVLHYSNNTKRMEAGELVVVDIGAEYNYYTADVTRTWPVSGTFSRRQREVYDLVLASQQAAERAYKPGTSIRGLHLAAVAAMQASPLRTLDGKTLDTAFIHGLGHFLGMDVHDVGDYSKPLQPGDVFTIEPGIYLSDEKLGVRIEDDYLVTKTGLVKLSKAIPSEPAEIEKLMRRAK